MVSPYCQAFLDYAAVPDPVEYYMGHRRALLPNGNMLEQVPVVNGFYSLYLPEQWEVWSLIYLRGGALPEPLLDFMGVTQISSDERLFAWDQRTNAMSFVSAGQRPVFADGADTLFSLAEQIPIYQRRQPIQQNHRQGTNVAADLLCRFQGAASRETGQPHEQALFIKVQQGIAPLNGVS